MRKLRFLATFLIIFAVLLALWSGTQGSRWYTTGLLELAGFVGPIMHGWVLETDPGGHEVPTWVHGAARVQLSIQFDALSVGLVPLLALLAATPAIGLPRRLKLTIAGGVLCFLVDAMVVALFPLLVFYNNPFTDVIGTFLGLIAFVGAPVIIWFGLTFRELRGWLPSLEPPALRSR